MFRRLTVVLIGVFLLAGSATVALADHDWIYGCKDGNACFREGWPWWSEAKSSDHRDANTYADLYYSGKSVGWHTDWVENEMNYTHAHVYFETNWDFEIGCLDPNDPDELDVRSLEHTLRTALESVEAPGCQ